jgi:hypothetical protein
MGTRQMRHLNFAFSRHMMQRRRLSIFSMACSRFVASRTRLPAPLSKKDDRFRLRSIPAIASTCCRS